MTNATRLRRPIAAAAALLFLLVPAAAAPAASETATRLPGAGELILDAPAVAAIIEAGIPEPIPFTLPAVGRITVRLEAPKRVDFRTGGLEAVVGIVVPELGLRGSVDLRYVPEIDRANGVVKLRAVRGKPGGMLAMLPDLSSMMPPVTVPGGFDRVLHPKGGSATVISVSVREIVVTDSHVVVKLGLESRPDEPQAAPDAPSRVTGG